MGRQKTGKNNVVTITPPAGGATVTPLHPAGAKPPQATASVKITPEQIAQRAHEIWVKQGCRHGQDQQHWLEAERQLKAELACQITVLRLSVTGQWASGRTAGA
jgi:hypothetical protein